MRQYINWKTYLIVAAMLIVAASLYYTSQLAKRLAIEEQKNVIQLVEALKTQYETEDRIALKYIQMVLEQNKTIPLILASKDDAIVSTINIDSSRLKSNPKFFREKLVEFRLLHKPIEFDNGYSKQYVYYGDSYLLIQLRYYPYIQLGIIILFLAIVLYALTTAHRSMQNQVWVGLSKETAHQLGTPLSSIEAWLELLKDNEENNEAVTEMQKDLDRLKLIADRFSKVGSSPQLEEENLVWRVSNMVDYMQKRSPQKVVISMKANEEDIPVHISGPLFDWVIENIIRNALDALDGKGTIQINIMNYPQQVFIDISDTGKGISKHQVKKIFNPGFTTKKRGWGLGLSLSRRIIEKYHHGSIFVKSTEVGKGTTFRIILRR